MYMNNRDITKNHRFARGFTVAENGSASTLSSRNLPTTNLPGRPTYIRTIRSSRCTLDQSSPPSVSCNNYVALSKSCTPKKPVVFREWLWLVGTANWTTDKHQEHLLGSNQLLCSLSPQVRMPVLIQCEWCRCEKWRFKMTNKQLQVASQGFYINQFITIALLKNSQNNHYLLLDPHSY